jgi:serine/threonine protein kinase
MSSGEDVLRDQISLIGFDQAFEISSPWPFDPVFEFLAPEIVVGNAPSPASDVWALGVTILNIQSDISLFPFCVDCPKHLITECVKYFGKLPASWKEPLYDKEGRPTTCTLRGRLRDVSHETCSLKQWIKDIYDEPTRANYNEATPSQPFIVREEHGSHPRNYNRLINEIAGVVNYDPEDMENLAAIYANDERPFPQHYANRVWKPSAIRFRGRYLPQGGGVRWLAYLPSNCDIEDSIKLLPRISEQEVELLHDLLSKIFVYEGRPSANDIMSHPWFTMGQEEA